MLVLPKYLSRIILLYTVSAFMACSKNEGAQQVSVPTVVSISSTSAAWGDTVTLAGTNFSAVTTSNVVKFNGAAAPVVDATATQLRVIVPSGVATGSVLVSATVNGQTGNFTFNFTKLGSITTLTKIGTSLYFQEPAGMAMDGSGNLFVSEMQTAKIHKISPSGVVTTFAGTGSLLPLTGVGADGTGTGASFVYITCMAFDPAGNIYVADGYSTARIRKISPSGVTTTLSSTFNRILGMVFDTSGNLFFTSGGEIRKLTSGGVSTVIAGRSAVPGNVDGTGSAAVFAKPSGITIDPAGNLYVADAGNGNIRKITPVGVVTTLAGTTLAQGSPGATGYADAAGTAALFLAPDAITIDASGNLYVIDRGNRLIRKITPSGVVTTLAGKYGATTEAGIDGNLNVATIGNANGVPESGSILFDAAGNLYFSEPGRYTIRKIIF